MDKLNLDTLNNSQLIRMVEKLNAANEFTIASLNEKTEFIGCHRAYMPMPCNMTVNKEIVSAILLMCNEAKLS